MVISNCQCLPIASWLTILSADTYFDFWGVHLPSPSERPGAVQALISRARAEYQLILTIPLSDEFDAIATSRIEATFPGIPIVKISNIYFSGLHPDLTYIGGLKERVVGPLVDYHSRLGLHGFLQGYSVAKTKALFTAATFAQAGFYDEYTRSLKELAARDANVDISVSTILETQLRRSLCFFSVNHPTSGLLAPYCQGIMTHLESRGLANPSGLPADPSVGAETLAGNVIFPIYPEIAAHHGLELVPVDRTVWRLV